MSAHNNTQNAEKTLSADPTKAMQEMMLTIDAVRDVYTRETEVLKAQDIKAFLRLQDEKLQTANIYKSRVEQLLARKSEIRGIDQAMKQKLADAQAEFAQLCSKNMSALKKMQRTTARLGSKIQEVAKDSVNKQNAVSYGQSGKLHGNERKRVSIGVSESA